MKEYVSGDEAPRTAEGVAARLRERIEAGTYAPGSRIPGRRRLVEELGVAEGTVGAAVRRLRDEGLVYAVAGGGWYVRPERVVVRSTRSRLSRAERAAGLGTFSSDCAGAGLTPDVHTDVMFRPADEELAELLDVEPGAELTVRDRTMAAVDAAGRRTVLQLATGHYPRELTRGTAIEHEQTGPGGVYARLEERGHELTAYDERVAIGRADEHEARAMGLTPGDPVYRVVRVAWAGDRPVEANRITIVGDRVELAYRLPAE